MENNVYVLVQTGVWDYDEEPTTILAFYNFKNALQKFKELCEFAKEDIKDWVDIEDIETEEYFDSKNGRASFSIYELGDYTRTHCNIEINKINII